MKKVLAGIFAAAIIFSAESATALAAGPGGHFIDADGDGICDNAGRPPICADADGDGVCDICLADYGSCPAGNGAAFVDVDGDGICDHYAAGQGRGQGGRLRGGRGNGFRGGRGR